MCLARQAASRLATFHDRPGSHTPNHARQPSGHSRTGSRSNSPLPSPAGPSTPSLTLNSSPRSPTLLKQPPHRARSTSLMGPPPLPSPSKEREPSRFFGAITNRSHKSPNTGDTTNSSGMGKSATNPGLSIPRQESPMKDIPRLRSPSPVDPSIRNSFGLPTISPDNGRFSGLGWSPVRPPSPSLRNASDPYRTQSRHSRNGSTSSLISNPGLGFGLTSSGKPGGSANNGNPMANLMRRKSSGRSRKSSDSSASRAERRRKAMSMVSAMEFTGPTGDLDDDDRSHYTPRNSERPRIEYNRSKTEVDAADGWRGEKVLYQCACVASL